MALEQRSLFEPDAQEVRDERSGTFLDNMQLPIHRWFRYSAGFSAEWVRKTIADFSKNRVVRVLDPFLGSGTVVLAAERSGAEAIGVEAHPFIARIARAKLGWRIHPDALWKHGQKVLRAATSHNASPDQYPALIHKCFPSETLVKLDALKRAWQASDDGSPASELTWLALVAILRAVSPVGTAQWQYVLPNKSKATSAEPFLKFEVQLDEMCYDMRVTQRDVNGPVGKVLSDDARECKLVPDQWADLVITSPPYANNYDYADATRLEMSFFGEIQRWGQLQTVVRDHLIRSCTQHVAPYVARSSALLETEELMPIQHEIVSVFQKLSIEREKHGGKKPYHAMIVYYFHDLSKVWRSLRRITKQGGTICFVVGDSAPYGIYVPVDKWLGELALAAGFKSFRFEKLRDRNTKWKNRKHTVPLHEGRLWVTG